MHLRIQLMVLNALGKPYPACEPVGLSAGSIQSSKILTKSSRRHHYESLPMFSKTVGLCGIANIKAVNSAFDMVRFPLY